MFEIKVERTDVSSVGTCEYACGSDGAYMVSADENNRLFVCRDEIESAVSDVASEALYLASKNR